MTATKKIGIVGLWHLGCVISAAWSKLGFDVTAFDYDQELIENLNRDKPPIFEPNLENTLHDSRTDGRLTFTNDIDRLKDCDFVFIAYDTPVLDNDESDLTPLVRAIDDLGPVLADEAVVIVSSQSPAGTCNLFRERLREKNESVELVYSPENLRLGQAIECYLKPDRIIIGAESEKATTKALTLFGNIQAELITMNLASAEMVKHAINSFLANSIVFANHLADLCELSGANILEVTKGVKSDPRIGQKAYLSPGIGFSGGTLGRDLQVLSKLNKKGGNTAQLYEKLLEFNNQRKTVILNKTAALLEDNLSGKTIAVLGLTYKPGTSTLRRSIPLEIAELLCQQNAKVKAYDPKADYSELNGEPSFEICSSIDDAITQCDLVILLTEWEDFRQYDWQRGAKLLKDKKIFDAKNFLYKLNLADKGFQYFGVGFTDQ